TSVDTDTSRSGLSPKFLMVRYPDPTSAPPGVARDHGCSTVMALALNSAACVSAAATAAQTTGRKAKIGDHLNRACKCMASPSSRTAGGKHATGRVLHSALAKPAMRRLEQPTGPQRSGKRLSAPVTPSTRLCLHQMASNWGIV